MVVGSSKLANSKEQIWLAEYLQCWNATEAARRAGYAHPNVQGSRLLANVSISDAVKERISEKAMSADEVLLRLGNIARGDIAEFMDINTIGYNLDLHKAKEAGKTPLVKKVKQKTTTFIAKKESDEDREVTELELELYPADAALVHLGKHHALFTDKHVLSGDGDDGTININIVTSDGS